MCGCSFRWGCGPWNARLSNSTVTPLTRPCVHRLRLCVNLFQHMHSIAERYDQHRYRQPSPCPLGLSEIARNGNVAPMSDSSVLSLLRERAGLQPDDAAFTYIDYEQDWAGITETLTWSEVFRRTRIVAHEVRRHCTTGDRAVILAPQGLAYIAAFLGSMQAGAIAVPLSVPQIGSHDERVSAVLADASPSVILTTSAVAEAVAEHIHRPNTNNVGRSSKSIHWT